MRQVLRAAGAIFLLGCVTSPPVAAFWPIQRSIPAYTDSLTPERIAKRFEGWKARPLRSLAADSTVARSQAGGAAPAPPPASGTYRFGESAPAPGDTADSATDSVTAAVDADSLAAALGTLNDLFPGLADSTDSAAADSAAAANGSSTPGSDAASGAQGANAAAAAAALTRRGFAPELSAGLSSTNDNMRLNSDLRTSFSDASGISLSSTLSYGEDISLTQKTNTETRGLTNSFSLPLKKQGMLFSLSTSNRKLDRAGQRTITNVRTSNSSDDRGAQFSATLSRPLSQLPGLSPEGSWANRLRGLNASSFYSRNFSQNVQSIIATAGTASGGREHDGSGNAYGAGLSVDRFDKWFTVKARVGRMTVGNRDRSASLVRAENPAGVEESTSEGDTATVDVTVPGRWIVKTMVMNLRTSQGSDTYTDATRTNIGGQTGEIGNFALETKSTFSQSVNLNATIRSLPKVETKVTLTVSRDSTSYALRLNQFSDSRRRNLRLENRLTYHPKGTLSVNYETNRNDINQDDPRNIRNPRNPLTRIDEERKLYVEVNQALTKTWKIRAFGEISLSQGFYEHPGPQGKNDRDELRLRTGLDMDGAIGSKVVGRVTMYVRGFDQSFIDRLRSASSKEEREYVVRPSFTYTIRPGIVVSQNYGLSSKVVDEIFNPNRNTLNRNHFMNTSLSYRLTGTVSLTANYDYLLQENGLYRAQPGSRHRFLAPQARTKKDGIGMGVSYGILKDGKLTFVSQQEATRERITDFGTGRQTIVERGNLRLGFDSKLKLGDLNLDCRLSRNQSFNVALNRNVYYNIDSKLSVTF